MRPYPGKKVWAIIAALTLALFLCACGDELLEKVPSVNRETAASKTAAAATENTALEAAEKPTLPVETVALETRIDTVYEKWLAAAAVTAIAMEAAEPDMDGLLIYINSETTPDKKEECPGIFITYRDGNEEKWLSVKPLAAPRTDKGTVDLNAADLGWAAFDYCEAPETAGYAALNIGDLTNELRQTLLVSLSRN